MRQFSAILGLLAMVLISTASGRCYDRCKFELCYSPVVRLGATDTDITGPICFKRNGVKIGVANTGEAKIKVFRRRGFFLQRISQFKPRGLKQRFSPSFFKSFSFRYYTYKNRYSNFAAVGHEVPQQNQLRFIRNKCVILPIKHYQVLDKRYNVVDNVNRAGRESCVAFYTK